jgi:hypothetical protein
VSQVWYSSEITGTIMVQCIPILRPILRDYGSSLRTKYTSTADRQSMMFTRRNSTRRASSGVPDPRDVKAQIPNMAKLRTIQEDDVETSLTARSSEERVGIYGLTSMINFSPTSPRRSASQSIRSRDVDEPSIYNAV